MWSTRLYQPYFIAGLAVITSAWAFAGVVVRGGSQFPIIATGTFLLAAVASLAVFAVWRLPWKDEGWLFFSSYAAWFFLAPIAWVVLHYGLLLFYAYVVTRCCEQSVLLQVTVWESLSRLTEGPLTPAVFSGLLLYLSLWLSMTGGSKVFRRIAQAMVFVSSIVFVLMMLVAFADI